jgi:menaquinone-dependent protoporphyrinogen oxidase
VRRGGLRQIVAGSRGPILAGFVQDAGAEAHMRVLVTAASRHGGTLDVADVIARALAAAGFEADLRPPDEVASVREYGAVVIGSAIYYGQWLPTAIDLIRRHHEAMAGLPVWLFSVGPAGSVGARAPKVPAIVAELVERTQARGHRVFAGARAGIRRWAREIASNLDAGRTS